MIDGADNDNPDLEFSRWNHRKGSKKKRGKRTNGFGESPTRKLLITRSSCGDCVLIESPVHTTVRPCPKHMEILGRPRKAPVRANR